MESHYQSVDSETKTDDRLLINSRAIVTTWDFILVKQKAKREMSILFQLVSDGVRSSQLLKEKVLIGIWSVSEASQRARTALDNLEQLYVTFKTFMEMTPDECSYQGVEFMMGREKRDCAVPLELEATGHLAMEGNLEFLVREDLQPPSLHDLPHFKLAYDLIIEGPLSIRSMQDNGIHPPLYDGNCDGEERVFGVFPCNDILW